MAGFAGLAAEDCGAARLMGQIVARRARGQPQRQVSEKNEGKAGKASATSVSLALARPGMHHSIRWYLSTMSQSAVDTALALHA